MMAGEVIESVGQDSRLGRYMTTKLNVNAAVHTCDCSCALSRSRLATRPRASAVMLLSATDGATVAQCSRDRDAMAFAESCNHRGLAASRATSVAAVVTERAKPMLHYSVLGGAAWLRCERPARNCMRVVIMLHLRAKLRAMFVALAHNGQAGGDRCCCCCTASCVARQRPPLRTQHTCYRAVHLIAASGLR